MGVVCVVALTATTLPMVQAAAAKAGIDPAGGAIGWFLVALPPGLGRWAMRLFPLDPIGGSYVALSVGLALLIALIATDRHRSPGRHPRSRVPGHARHHAAGRREQRLLWTSMLFPGYRPAVFDDIPITAVMSMEAVGDGTRYVFTALHRSAEERDANMTSGFSEGSIIAVDQLVAHVLAMR